MADFTGDGYADLVTLFTTINSERCYRGRYRDGCGEVWRRVDLRGVDPCDPEPAAIRRRHSDYGRRFQRRWTTRDRAGYLSSDTMQRADLRRRSQHLGRLECIEHRPARAYVGHGLFGGGPLRCHGPRPTRGRVPARLGQCDRGHDRFRCIAPAEPQGGIAGHHRVRRILFRQGGSPGLVLALRLRGAGGWQ